MAIRDLFTISRKKNTDNITRKEDEKSFPEGIVTKCPKCKTIHVTKELEKNLKVCAKCQHHFTLNANERIAFFLDEGSFVSMDDHLQTTNPLNFPAYVEKVEADIKKTGLNEAVLTGVGALKGMQVVVAVMDSHFRMGSMGSVVGEKITRAVEKATELKVPFIIYTASGGARMQEGVKRHSEEGLLYISILTHPTTGGVSASFASIGDYNIAEPQSLIGFAGRRVIEQTVREKLPDDFQTAEFLLDHGQLDAIFNRTEMRDKIATIVKLHVQGGVSHV